MRPENSLASTLSVIKMAAPCCVDEQASPVFAVLQPIDAGGLEGGSSRGD